ncbi:MAG: hypothetical protein RLZZ628_1781 [Bacteroidota bacterium]|jgi:hypothetical protein
MIIELSVALVSTVLYLRSQAKIASLETQSESTFKELSRLDHLEEENRILTTANEVLETNFYEKKAALEEKEQQVKELSSVRATEGDPAGEVERLKETAKKLVWDRDHYKSLWDKTWDEKNAYKKLYEEATKKAPQ